ncbi:MAG: hypothetical protein LBV12_06215 [Puniceicoccales bacterium]|jgi:hypothetical protein|nr:hypothetical protein [Puniceicoccales bacterium]
MRLFTVARKFHLRRVLSSKGVPVWTKHRIVAGKSRVLQIISLMGTGVIMSGCNELPSSIPVIGAYFPDWIFCSIGGIVMAAVVRTIIQWTKFEHRIGMAVLFYPALALIFSCLIWLLFF